MHLSLNSKDGTICRRLFPKTCYFPLVSLSEEDYAWLLTIPGEFVSKYSLEGIVGIFYVFLQGFGNLLAQPTVYIMRAFDLQMTTTVANGNFVKNSRDDNQRVFDMALQGLRSGCGSSVFLSSTVLRVERGDHVRVIVDTPDGRKIIKTSKLLIAIPPKLSNLPFLDLNPADSDLLGRFNNSYYYAAVLSNTGIPDDIQGITNVNPDAPLYLPAQPSTYGLLDFDNGFRGAYYGSTAPLTIEAVKKDIVAGVARLGYSGDPKIDAFVDHSPSTLTVSPHEIREGFYRKLLKLQGEHNTWWTGAAWHTASSAGLWEYTEEQVLPGLIADL